ncbi:KH domain-containing protein, partial [Candidatus Dojkabacteria bacterium]|nr:KH domain-containing protein [Candidatus Dojkabacteria bacterium]
MGQKINPTGFRIGVNKGWNSTWYAPKNQFADLLLEDIKVRDYVKEKLQNAGVGAIEVKRSMNKILIEVKVARPGVVIGRGGAGIEALKKDLNK